MKKSKRIPFTSDENNFIKESVKLLGCNWNLIAEGLPGRTPKQIHDRYFNYLRDGLIGHPWTKEEDDIVISLYDVYGTKWSKMMPYLPGRSGNDIKNRWHKHLVKTNRFDSSALRNVYNQQNNGYVCPYYLMNQNENNNPMMKTYPCFYYFYVQPALVQMINYVPMHYNNNMLVNEGKNNIIKTEDNAKINQKDHHDNEAKNEKIDLRISSIFDQDFDFQDVLEDIYSEFMEQPGKKM